MKGEVLVKARPRIQYDMSGKPSMYFEQGGPGQRGLPSKRERVAGALGGAVGVLGGLTGKHRSLGSLLGSMYAGKVQGEGVGRSIAGKTVMPKRRAELELEAQSRAEQGRKEGVKRMKRRVERAEEAQDRINAPAGANTQGVVSQLRDKVRVRRTPQYMRDDFRAAETAEAEREAQAQAKQQRREVSRQDLARARQLREYTPQQLEQFRRIDPEGLERLERVASVIMPNAFNRLPSLGQQFPNAQLSQTPVPPLTTAPGAQTVLQAGEQVPDEFNDHSSQDQGLAAHLGQQVVQEEEEEESVMGLSASQLRAALEMGLNGQR